MITNKSILVCLIITGLALAACGGRNDTLENTSAMRPGIKLDQYGLLRFSPRIPCPFSTGCGPEFSLLSEDLQQITPLTGKLDPAHDGMLVVVQGKSRSIEKKHRDFLRTSSAGYGIKVKRYRIVSAIAYHGFLIEQAEIHTTRKYGCSVLWDKTFSWRIREDRPYLVVKMTNTQAQAPRPFLELAYDGITGHLMNEVVEPPTLNPCPQA